MSNTRFNPGLGLLMVSLAWLAACGGGDLGLPSSSGEGVSLSIVDGNGQTGTVGQELPDPLVVSVQSGGSPIPGHEVAFILAGDPAGGVLEPDTAVTGDDGRAITHLVLGPEAGPYAVEARLVVAEPDPPPVAVFEASAVAGEPDTARAASVTSQPGRRGEAVAESPVLLVVDRFGNPVAGTPVEWAVTAGGGEVSGAGTTDGEGAARATWILGEGIGVQKLRAQVEGVHGSPVTFTATVLF
jgi:hypothetical protein